jgi:hypothetical protein
MNAVWVYPVSIKQSDVFVINVNREDASIQNPRENVENVIHARATVAQ